MKATLEFQLPMEQYEHRAALLGMAYKAGLEGIRQDLRGKIKYGHEFETADEALEYAYKLVCDTIMECDNEGLE
jgi:hypothetical protein